MNKLKCPNCFNDLSPMLERIGATQDLHSGNYILCDNDTCEQVSMVGTEDGQRFLAIVEGGKVLVEAADGG